MKKNMSESILLLWMGICGISLGAMLIILLKMGMRDYGLNIPEKKMDFAGFKKYQERKDMEKIDMSIMAIVGMTGILIGITLGITQNGLYAIPDVIVWGLFALCGVAIGLAIYLRNPKSTERIVSGFPCKIFSTSELEEEREL